MTAAYIGLGELSKKVDDRINETDGKSGDREQNFDFIHYREIIRFNWNLFKDAFAYGDKVLYQRAVEREVGVRLPL